MVTMNDVNKYAPLFAASRAGMPWRGDGETAPTVIVGTERIASGTLTVTVLSGPTISVDGGKAYTMDEVAAIIRWWQARPQSMFALQADVMRWWRVRPRPTDPGYICGEYGHADPDNSGMCALTEER